MLLTKYLLETLVTRHLCRINQHLLFSFTTSDFVGLHKHNMDIHKQKQNNLFHDLSLPFLTHFLQTPTQEEVNGTRGSEGIIILMKKIRALRESSSANSFNASRPEDITQAIILAGLGALFEQTTFAG